MVGAREQCREVLQGAVPALEAAAPQRATTQHLRSWLALYQLTEKRRWLDKLGAALVPSGIDHVAPEERGEWARICCDCWVLDASGPFRETVRALLPTLPAGAAAIPALLRNWRITGDSSYCTRALEQLPEPPEVGEYLGAAAYLAAYHATGDPDQLQAASGAFVGAHAAELPLYWWPLAWNLLSWSPEELVDTVSSWSRDAPPAHEVLPALVAATLPSLDLRVLWWDNRELAEGYVAEAVTFPYPALRLRFERMERPGQVRFAPSLGGAPREILEDAGIIASLLSHLVDEVDRQGVVTAGRPRPGRGKWRR